MLKELLNKILLKSDGTVSTAKAGATATIALSLVALLAKFLDEKTGVPVPPEAQEWLVSLVTLALGAAMLGLRNKLSKMTQTQEHGAALAANTERRVIEVAKAVEAPPPPLAPVPPKAG